MQRMTKKAAQIVYNTTKYGSRGEFGETLLHIAIRQIYQTIPAVSKIYYKSAVNETVKGEALQAWSFIYIRFCLINL